MMDDRSIDFDSDLLSFHDTQMQIPSVASVVPVIESPGQLKRVGILPLISTVSFCDAAHTCPMSNLFSCIRRTPSDPAC